MLFFACYHACAAIQMTVLALYIHLYTLRMEVNLSPFITDDDFGSFTERPQSMPEQYFCLRVNIMQEFNSYLTEHTLYLHCKHN